MGNISFTKGDQSGLGSIQLNPLSPGIDVNANWTATGSGRKGLLGKLTKGSGQDLDVVAVASVGKDPVLMAWYDDEDPFENGALKSLGDDRKGRGGETMETRWAGLDSNIDRITYILAAFKPGVTFANVSRVVVSAHLAALEGVAGVEISRFRPAIDSAHNAIILGQSRKTGLDNGTGQGLWTYQMTNTMATIPRNATLDPGPEFKAGVLAVARAWAEVAG
jgi:hypothetical protein